MSGVKSIVRNQRFSGTKRGNRVAGGRILLTPAGGAIAAISFFLPWIQISCLGTSSYSGMDFGGIYWIVFAMACLIFAAYFLLRRLRHIEFLQLAVVTCTAIALAIILYGCLLIAGGKKILLIRFGPEDVHLKLHVGGYGTALGFLMALAGVLPFRRRSHRPESPDTS